MGVTDGETSFLAGTKGGLLITIGIDPGQKGGIAILDRNGTCIKYTKMPDTVKQTWLWLIDNLPDRQVQMIIERAQSMPRQGVTSMFTYGRHFGQFEAFACALSVPYIEVTPQKWKKYYNISSDKHTSIVACERLYPEVELILKGCRKPHDGIAEAVLIAGWVVRVAAKQV